MGMTPTAIATGDLNGDGIADAVGIDKFWELIDEVMNSLLLAFASRVGAGFSPHN
jgi:hypothetical protein